MIAWESIACTVTDHWYDWSAEPSPRCRICGTDEYWPARKTLGRLIGDLFASIRRWRNRWRFPDQPF